MAFAVGDIGQVDTAALVRVTSLCEASNCLRGIFPVAYGRRCIYPTFFDVINGSGLFGVVELLWAFFV